MNILLIIIYYFYYILYSYHNHSYFISTISYTKKTVSCKIVRFIHSVVHLEVMEGLLLCANAPDVPNNRNAKNKANFFINLVIMLNKKNLFANIQYYFVKRNKNG